MLLIYECILPFERGLAKKSNVSTNFGFLKKLSIFFFFIRVLNGANLMHFWKNDGDWSKFPKWRKSVNWRTMGSTEFSMFHWVSEFLLFETWARHSYGQWQTFVVWPKHSLKLASERINWRVFTVALTTSCASTAVICVLWSVLFKLSMWAKRF